MFAGGYFFYSRQSKKIKKNIFFGLKTGEKEVILHHQQKGGYMKKDKKPLPIIGLRATEDEQEMFKKIRKVRKIPSNSHVIRVLVTEECERISAKNTPIGVNIGE